MHRSLRSLFGTYMYLVKYEYHNLISINVQRSKKKETSMSGGKSDLHTCHIVDFFYMYGVEINGAKGKKIHRSIHCCSSLVKLFRFLITFAGTGYNCRSIVPFILNFDVTHKRCI